MRSRKGAAMYRVILKSRSLEYDKVECKYKDAIAESRFDCKDYEQAMGLIELMVSTSDCLEFSVFKVEEDE